MSGILKETIEITDRFISSTFKRVMLSKCLKKAGFISVGKGAWIGFRGTDIVSGLLIEGSSLDTYITAFILPIFDNLTFVSWSLGRRLVHCSTSDGAKAECDRAFEMFREEYLTISSPIQLIDYIEQSGRQGFYSIWAKYLCYLREGMFDSARNYFDEERRARLHRSVLDKLVKIEPYVIQNDKIGIREVLNSWEAKSRRIFGSGNFSITI